MGLNLGAQNIPVQSPIADTVRNQSQWLLTLHVAKLLEGSP